MAEPEVRLREAEVVRELLARRLRDDARAGEGRQRARLGEDHVSEAREARSHTAGRGMREHRDQHTAGVLQVPDRAHGLRELHQREDALLHPGSTRRRDGDQRTPSSAVRSQARANCSPTTLPIEPPMNAKSIAASGRGGPRSGPAGENRVAEPGPELCLGQTLHVRPEIEELQRVGRPQVAVLLVERAGVGELRDALARTDGEVVAALRADAELSASSSSR